MKRRLRPPRVAGNFRRRKPPFFRGRSADSREIGKEGAVIVAWPEITVPVGEDTAPTTLEELTSQPQTTAVTEVETTPARTIGTRATQYGGTADSLSAGRIFLYIIGVAVILVAAYYTTYYLGKRSKRTYKGQNIRMLDRFAFSKDKSIVIMEIAGKVYIVSMTTQGSTVLDTMSLEEYSDAVRSGSGGVPDADGYEGGMFQRFMAAMKDNVRARYSKNGAPGPAAPKAAAKPDKPSVPTAREEDDLDVVYRKLQARKAKNSFDQILENSSAPDGDDDTEGGGV